MNTDPTQDLPPAASDSRQDVPEEPPAAAIARAKLRASATYAAQATAALNAGPVLPTRDPASGKLRYETSPVAVKRLFGSPLATTGSTNVVVLRGSILVRRVTSGWNDARSFGYDDKVDHNRRHAGLDFPGPVGETVLASADGIVSFVGVQRRSGGSLPLTSISVDGEGNAVGLDESGKQVTIDVKQLAFGGVFIQITHKGDFQGFKTEYFHLSATTVTKGQKVLEGDPIGKIGTSGGNRGVVHSPHLHWQVRYGVGSIIVKPEPLVLHYNPRSPADIPGADILAETATQLQKHGTLSAGESAIVGAGISEVRGQNRAVDAQNQTLADHRQRQASYYEYVSQQEAVSAGRMHQATAQFQAAQPVVQGAMTFDFSTGLWSDGRPL